MENEFGTVESSNTPEGATAYNNDANDKVIAPESIKELSIMDGAWYNDIYVVKGFKVVKKDGTEIEFKPDAVEEGLVIPLMRPDGVPYYQLINYDMIDFIIEQFISKRLMLGRQVEL